MRRVFRSYCAKAMTSGDIQAIAVIAEKLLEAGQRFGWTRQDILMQVKQEYEVDFETKLATFESESESRLGLTRMETAWQPMKISEVGEALNGQVTHRA
jgi:hypothetical protein